MWLCIYNGMLFSCKKEGKWQFVATGMDFEESMLREVSQKEKDKYCRLFLICGI